MALQEGSKAVRQLGRAVENRQSFRGSRWTSYKGRQGASGKRANRDFSMLGMENLNWLVGIRVYRMLQVVYPSTVIYLTKLYKKLLAILLDRKSVV